MCATFLAHSLPFASYSNWSTAPIPSHGSWWLLSGEFAARGGNCGDVVIGDGGEEDPVGVSKPESNSLITEVLGIRN